MDSEELDAWRARRERDARLQHIDDVRKVLATPEGRRVWAWAMRLCGVDELSYSPGDTHGTAMLEGRRSVGRQLREEAMRLAPSEYFRTVTEALSHLNDTDFLRAVMAEEATDGRRE